MGTSQEKKNHETLHFCLNIGVTCTAKNHSLVPNFYSLVKYSLLGWINHIYIYIYIVLAMKSFFFSFSHKNEDFVDWVFAMIYL